MRVHGQEGVFQGHSAQRGWLSLDNKKGGCASSSAPAYG